MINLDNNATTPLTHAVINRMTELMRWGLANPSSQHAAGRRARAILENARESILHSIFARTTGMASDQLIFTSGGTESNNLAVFGFAEKNPGAIIVSDIEHPSVLECAEHLRKLGRPVIRIPCDDCGIVSLKALDSILSDSSRAERIALVSLMMANNETGVIQPIAEAAQICHQYDVPIHTDASQAFGKIPVNFQLLEVDAMTITAHKLHGPIGIGALVLRREYARDMPARLYGGFQQQGVRPGTESPLLAGAFETASRSAVESLDTRSQMMRSRRDEFQRLLKKGISNTFIIAEEAPRLPNTLSIAFPGADRQALQLALDIAGVACSTGSACASGSSQPSPVLQAMGLPLEVLASALRFAVSIETTSDEIIEAASIITEVVERIRKNNVVLRT